MWMWTTILACLSFGTIAWSETVCRLRQTNVTAKIVHDYIKPNFVVKFSTAGGPVETTKTGFYVNDYENSIDLYFKVQKPAGALLKEILFTVPLGIVRIGPFEARCIDLNSEGVSGVGSKTYKLQLAIVENTAPSGEQQSRRFNVQQQEQSQFDCYIPEGNVHPYSLEASGKYVAHDEDFTIECSMSGKCANGNFAGVSRCPPFILPPGDTYVELRKRGHCCSHGVTKSEIEGKGCPKIASKVVSTSENLMVDGPWLIRFKPEGQNTTCDGALVSKRYFIAPSKCFSSGRVIIVQHPGKATGVTVVGKTELGEDLKLAQIDKPIVEGDWMEHVQPVNLPWASLCNTLTTASCHIAIGSKREVEAGARFTQPYVDQSPVVDGEIVQSQTCTITAGSNKLCVKKSGNLPVQQGAFVSGWVERYNFLIGLYAGKQPTNAALDRPDTEQTGVIYSICPHIDAIKQKIQSDN